mgnify:FL=1
MTEITDMDIGQAITGMMQALDDEYAGMTQADLERRWFFRFDHSKSLEANIYAFQDMLRLYAGSCRRWEERHNGGSCVVERVRDTYLKPKIQDFAAEVRRHVATEIEKEWICDHGKE